MEDSYLYAAPPGWVRTRNDSHGFVCHHIQSIKLNDSLSIDELERPGGTIPPGDLRWWNDHAMPSARIRLRKVLPDAAIQCLSHDIDKARRGFVRYLSLLPDVLPAIGCFTGDEPIRRLHSAFMDMIFGAEVSLFKLPEQGHRRNKGFAYQDVVGVALIPE